MSTVCQNTQAELRVMRMLKVSFGRLKLACDTRLIHFNYIKRSLRNEKLKANRASETEEQRKERLRIRREKDRARSNYKRERKGRQKQKTTRNSA